MKPKIHPIDRKLLKTLKPSSIVDANSLILYHRTAIATFGYSTITKQGLQDYDIDITKAADDFGWVVEVGHLAVVVTLEAKTRPLVEFGEKPPTRNELRKIQGTKTIRH